MFKEDIPEDLGLLPSGAHTDKTGGYIDE